VEKEEDFCMVESGILCTCDVQSSLLADGRCMRLVRRGRMSTIVSTFAGPSNDEARSKLDPDEFLR